MPGLLNDTKSSTGSSNHQQPLVVVSSVVHHVLTRLCGEELQIPFPNRASMLLAKGWGMENPGSPVLFAFFSLHGSGLEKAGDHRAGRSGRAESSVWERGEGATRSVHRSKNWNNLRAACLLAPHSQIICPWKGRISERLQRNTDWFNNIRNSFEGAA